MSPETRRVLKVFLASPNDVEKERRDADEVVDLVNIGVGKQIGWYVELTKWEETPPAYGRPQGIINAAVDSCDLFIGLLWERWGQPSGEYSSGFHEEFERARKRREIGDAPEIWLVFKTVDEEKLKDPGDHLKRVLEFRKEVEASRQVFFKELPSRADWRGKLQSWLSSYLLKLEGDRFAKLHPQADSPPTPIPPDAAALETASPSPPGNAAILQLSQVLSRFQENLETEGEAFLESAPAASSELDVVRLFSFSLTLMAHRYTNEVMGIHELNLLYKHRQNYAPTAIERYQLLRSLISDEGDNRPGWYWFREMTQDDLAQALFSLAHKDSSQTVQAQALSLLTAAGVPVPRDWWPFLPFESESLSVRQELLNLTIAMPASEGQELLHLLESVDSPITASEISQARFQIEIRENPEKAISEAATRDGYLSQNDLSLIREELRRIPDEALRKALESSWGNIREIALTELGNRGLVTLDAANKYAKDPDLDVRRSAYRILAMLGALQDFDEMESAAKGEQNAFLMGDNSQLIDDIKRTAYSKMTAEQLRSRVEWFSVDGPLAYEVMATKTFDVFANELRKDISEGFTRVRETSLKALEEQYGPIARVKFEEKYKQYDSFIASMFLKAALSVLAKHASAEDIPLIRTYVRSESRDIREAAASIVAQAGTHEDAELLLQFAKDTHGMASTQAAEAAIRLAKDPLAVFQELLTTNNERLASVAVHWLARSETAQTDEVMRRLLSDENASTRMLAIGYFTATLQRPKLVELLDHYIQQDSYYYNVATWLDRILYCPPVLRDAFASRLQRSNKSQ